ncbi:hypothetical protein, partial [Nocardioides bruguierae]|nr:hypothetical protein [Nocardioides bruguierae]
DSPIGGPLLAGTAALMAFGRAADIASGFAARFETRTEAVTSAARTMTRTLAAGAGLSLFIAGIQEADEDMRTLMTTAGGAATGLAVAGPWGAAIGGAIGLIVGLGTSSDTSSEAVQALTDSFDLQTGAITENTRAMIAKRAQESGLYDDAEALGLSASLVTDAILGNAAAQRELNAAVAGYDVDYTQTSAEDLKQSFSEQEIATILADRAATNLRDTVPEMADQFALASADARQLAAAMDTTGGSTGDYSNQAERAARRTERLTVKLNESRDAAQKTADDFITLGDSLDDGEVSLRKWIRQLERQADALRNFRRNAIEAAERGLNQGLITALEEAGSAGALRMRQLANASDEEIDRANRAWQRGQREVNRYVDAIGGVPSDITTTVTTDTSQAIAGLTQAKQMLDSLQDKTVTIRYTSSGTAAVSPGFGPREYSGGGFTGPGGKYEPAGVVHRGEVVIPQELVRRDWSMLKSRYGSLPGFAEGGVVTGGLESRGEQLQLMATIRQLTRDLAKTGDDQLKGLNRRIAANNLAQARRDLQLARLAPALDKAAVQMEKATTRLDKVSSRLDGVRQASEALSESIAGNLKSDLFGGGWGGSDVATLRSDIRTARDFRADVRTLRRKGLSGGLLQEVLSEGATTTDMYAGLSRSQLAQRERLYNQRERLTSAAGDAGANARYGRRERALENEVRTLRREVRGLRRDTVASSRDNADRVASAVNGAGAAGKRRARKARTR